MKVAIITIHKIYNYGSTLQAYAMQRFLELNSIDSELIDYLYPTSDNINRMYKSMHFFQALRLILHFMKESLMISTWIQRKRFRQFWDEFYRVTKPYHNFKALSEEKWNHDIYIVGSDQVWNTKTVQGDPAFLLAFLPDNFKRFSFSSSFGIDKIDEQYKKLFQTYLSNFEAIGIREKSGISILEDLNISKPVKMVCDPTLLLSPDDYNVIRQRAQYDFDFDYIFVYTMVYAFNPNPGLVNVINEAVKRYKCKVVFFGIKTHLFKGDCIHIADGGPCDFVNLLSKAKYVVTSSFHGTAFSIIYKKPFTSIVPRKGDKRLNDIIEELCLDDCLVYNDEIKVRLSTDAVFNASFNYKYQNLIDDSKSFFLKQLQ